MDACMQHRPHIGSREILDERQDKKTMAKLLGCIQVPVIVCSRSQLTTPASPPTPASPTHPCLPAPSTRNAAAAVNQIVEDATQCKFESTNNAQDEIVLLNIVQVWMESLSHEQEIFCGI